MKTFTIITLLLSSFLINAQDTIYFKNKMTVPAKIIEVRVSEIKYQRLDNLTGPYYMSGKNEIRYIKYANGITDTIHSVTPVYTNGIEMKVFRTISDDDIRIHGGRISHHGKTINDRDLKWRIKNLPSSEKRFLLQKEFKKLNEYKIMESVVAPVLFAAGAGIHFAALGSAFGSNGGAGSKDGTTLASAFIAGAVLRISGHVINIVYRNKKKSKREDIVHIYNEQY